MTAAEKFLFAVDFDEPPTPSSPVELENEIPPPPSFSEDELEAARQESLINGRDQGRKEAAQAIEQACTNSLDVISGQLDQLARQLDGRLERIERDSLLAALTVVRKLFPALARREELSEIEAVLKDCLQRLHDEPRIVVRSSEAMLEILRPRIEKISNETGFEGRLVLLSDTEFRSSDVKVEWADGGAERNTARMWAKIEARFSQLFKTTALCEAVQSPTPRDLDPGTSVPDCEPSGQGSQTDPTGQSHDDQEGLPQ